MYWMLRERALKENLSPLFYIDILKSVYVQQLHHRDLSRKLKSELVLCV